MKSICLIILILTLSSISYGQNSGWLTNNGTWCWFSDPRAILVDGNVYTGWVKSDGSIEAATFNLKTKELKKSELYYQLERDDHNNPAFVYTPSGKVIAMYTRHSKKDLFINELANTKDNFKFTEPQFIHPFSQSELERFPRATMSYANPFCLKKEDNRIYCFGRWVGFKPNMMWSDDEGITWSKSKVFITNYPFHQNNRPYVKYYSDGQSKIHIVFTNGHPRVEPTNSVYYACYEDGEFKKANGEVICNMEQIPFEPKEASIIFRSNEQEGRAWIADIGQDENGNPIILYTKSPSEDNHQYWYAKYTDTGWVSTKICDSGKWFPHTPEGKREREPHYFGGLCLHPDNCNVVYLSRQVNNIFEIERWETIDGGKNWQTESITMDSEQDNVRPYVPQGLKKTENEVVLWMENQHYVHYTDFKTSIKYSIRTK